MTSSVQQVTEKPVFTILITAISISLIDNIIIAFSASIPWIIHPDVHAFFMASVIAVLSVFAIIILAKKENLKLKSEVAMIPFVVFSISFFVDRYILNYIRNIAVPVRLLSFTLSSSNVSFMLGFVFTLLFIFSVLGLTFLVIK